MGVFFKVTDELLADLRIKTSSCGFGFGLSPNIISVVSLYIYNLLPAQNATDL